MRYITAFLFALLAAAPLAAQDVGATYRLKFRDVRVDSVKGGSVFYCVLASEATPGTVGRCYKMNLNTFLADYTLKTPPPDTTPTPPSATLVYYGGNSQAGAPGATLEQSISVRVVDAGGAGVNGDTILFTVASGGGSLDKQAAPTATVDGRIGWAGARWTLGASGEQKATAIHKKTGQGFTFSATLASAPPPPPPDTATPLPLPTDTSVIASTNFDNASAIPLPFTAGDGSAGNANVFVAVNPSGAGKVLALRFRRTQADIDAGFSHDINRAMALYGLNQSPQIKIGYGRTVYMQGRILLPAPQSNMVAAQRKLFYFQPSAGGGPIAVLKADELVPGSATRQQLKFESNNHFYPNFAFLEFGVWTVLKVQITNNSAPNVADGVVRVWKDGALVLERFNQRFLMQPADAWATFLIGQQTQDDPSKTFDEWRYWDDVAIGRK